MIKGKSRTKFVRLLPFLVIDAGVVYGAVGTDDLHVIQKKIHGIVLVYFVPLGHGT